MIPRVRTAGEGLVERSLARSSGRRLLVRTPDLDDEIDSLLARALLPGLLPFIGANVGVSVDIAATRPSEWQTGDFDIAVGFTRPDSGPLLIRKVADMGMSMAVGCAPERQGASHRFTLDFVDGA